MRQSWIKTIRAFFVPLLALMLSACQTDDFQVPHTGPHEVGFYAGGSTQTRTEMLPNGLSAVWTAGDELAVWAKNSSGVFTLSNQIFKTYGIDGRHGFFTSTLNSPMPEGDYIYYCTYPAPISVNETKATFNIPAVQDGKVSGGADIMIATPVPHGALTPVPDPEDHSGMSMKMNRMLHQFRFYVPQDDTWLGSEEIEKIELHFPKAVVGNVSLDITGLSTSSSTPTNPGSSVTLKLSDPIAVTYQDQYDYACLAINPTSFKAGESMSLRAYTASRILFFDPVDLQARTFKAGHSTSVKLKITNTIDYGRVFFTVSANNLGENANSITLTAPTGCVWGNTGSNVYTYRPGYEISAGERFEIMFEDIDAYRNLSEKSITVTFDTEHVNTSQTIIMPDMSSGSIAEISASMPYLLYEDFSSVGTFSSNDAYSGGFVSGSKGAHSFLNGWTGGRIGAAAGKCIRIACRRETSARYPARVDSAPIIELKKTADIVVTFDYGMNNQYSGGLISNADVGQTFYVGYVQSDKAFKSGDDDGKFDAGTYMHDKTGSYDSTPYNDSFILTDVPTGMVRISWRTEIENNAGLTNTTCWLYIDNVKVQIAK